MCSEKPENPHIFTRKQLMTVSLNEVKGRIICPKHDHSDSKDVLLIIYWISLLDVFPRFHKITHLPYGIWGFSTWLPTSEPD